VDYAPLGHNELVWNYTNTFTVYTKLFSNIIKKELNCMDLEYNSLVRTPTLALLAYDLDKVFFCGTISVHEINRFVHCMNFLG
jgi:hypothetical protein